VTEVIARAMTGENVTVSERTAKRLVGRRSPAALTFGTLNGISPSFIRRCFHEPGNDPAPPKE
jgi:hypothetical protein